MTKRDLAESSDIDSDSRIETQSESESDQSRPSLSLWEEFCFLVVHEKKWWLVPILISLAVIAIAVAFCQLTKVPFIYRLF
jgi:hypothetical protein